MLFRSLIQHRIHRADLLIETGNRALTLQVVEILNAANVVAAADLPADVGRTGEGFSPSKAASTVTPVAMRRSTFTCRA